MISIVSSFDKWLEKELQNINCQDTTKAYIISVLKQNKQSIKITDSITLKFAFARSTGIFYNYQELADYILWLKSIIPDAIEPEQNDYIETIARLSYYNCYRLLNKKWLLYEELADRFPHITTQINNVIYLKNNYGQT